MKSSASEPGLTVQLENVMVFFELAYFQLYFCRGFAFVRKARVDCRKKLMYSEK